ncbi:MAG: hypothetical protein H0Z19_06965 [Archaeoglobus sp.]|uniref:hypothetical protein n=1 Tax=Archaeoglobus sp. TaxID=1872626 RepID=UPI001E05EEAF|nr:hypothetical protein [Archaeoglobus sp.]MBO8180208.1 hypothetical protein [Archaeoglobus sp.]
MRIIIRCEGEIINYGWEEHNAWLGVRKDMLRDYLSARRCGLLIVRYAEKALKTPVKLELEEYQKETEFGKYYFVIIDDPISGEYIYLSRLWESFWIDPASEPKRQRYKTSEFEFGVEFKDEDGEHIKFANEKIDYFKLISFSPSMFKVFLSELNNEIKFNTLTTLTLKFADGEYLDGCINKYGQFQTFLGSLAKLSHEKQKKLSTFSEPKKADPPAEFIRINVYAEFPETYPIGWTISRCLKDVNKPWIDRFGKNLLLNPDEDKLSECILLGLISREFRELADVMLEFRKLVIPEYKINEIKDDPHFSYLSKEKNYKEMKSIKFTQLLFRKHRTNNRKGESYILDVINELRQCKGHPDKSVEDVLLKFGIPNENPRISFIYILTEFLEFLFAFKELTENLLDISIKVKDETKNPWYQLRIALECFSKLI